MTSIHDVNLKLTLLGLSFLSYFSVLHPLLLFLVWNDKQGRKDSVMTGVHRELAIIDVWSTPIWSLFLFWFSSVASSDSQMLHEGSFG